jgi:hypothetical protein
MPMRVHNLFIEGHKRIKKISPAAIFCAFLDGTGRGEERRGEERRGEERRGEEV